MSLNPDSLTGKLLISIFDKIFLGLAAALITILIQHSVNETESKNSRIRTVSSVHTEVIKNAISNLQKEMAEMLSIAQEMTENIGNEKSKELSRNLVSFRNKISTTLDLLETFVPEVKDPSNNMTKKIDDFYTKSRKKEIDGNSLDKIRDELQKEYKGIIDALKRGIIRVVNGEWGVSCK
jgi:hypothetical protein